MAIEILSVPSYKMVMFRNYVCLAEGRFRSQNVGRSRSQPAEVNLNDVSSMEIQKSWMTFGGIRWKNQTQIDTNMIPSGNLTIALENDHRNSGFSH